MNLKFCDFVTTKQSPLYSLSQQLTTYILHVTVSEVLLISAVIDLFV